VLLLHCLVYLSRSLQLLVCPIPCLIRLIVFFWLSSEYLLYSTLIYGLLYCLLYGLLCPVSSAVCLAVLSAQLHCSLSAWLHSLFYFPINCLLWYLVCWWLDLPAVLNIHYVHVFFDCITWYNKTRAMRPIGCKFKFQRGVFVRIQEKIMINSACPSKMPWVKKQWIDTSWWYCG
jgi:hypothetical protein